MTADIDTDNFHDQKALEILHKKFSTARQKRDIAFKNYDRALQVRNGQTPGATPEFQRAYFEYIKSHEDVLDALVKLNACLLDRKPEKSGAASLRSKKRQA